MKKQYAVFGLGRFGGSLVKEFYELGVEVLAIDIDQEKVDQYAQFVTYAVQINGIDEAAIKDAGMKNIDHAFVSFGENIESSILTSLLLKEMGIPQVWAKAHNDYHAKVLDKIGVDRVIHPERDMAKRIAHHIVSEKMIDYIELSEDYSMVEIVASDKIHNKSLLDLNIRAKYGCNIVGIQRGKEIIVSPPAEEVIFKGDVLIVMGRNKGIGRFERHGV
ncbi:trk system potassium uptake protein TrkA [Cytobacillus oceanisediminis]|jgi:trk system potassium uptake protein TrkA|uniref:Trk system potassium uptake protein TrkA n=1 Tax=Cytobacillus oceanisediminis TaxID=665099 RepID=A0A2V3A0F5_9BACI|nr:TrkA family potassium uptake protein [Cytobacillus oceanisediminis]PWW28223.1 trk system potassium uptake protein TrkA [Cytobacillus oceanisediminis]